MDPVTHTLAGATMARAGLDRRTPLATAALLLGANAPDIDIAAAFGGANATLEWRRGWTHGPIALLLLPFVITGLLLAWDRWVRRRRSPDTLPAYGIPLLQAASIGVLSHPALDWLNTYGIRLLMPFSGTWFRGDSVFIIDPYLWLMLGIGLYAARRAQPDARRVQHRARVMGGAAAAYIVGLIALSAAGERSGATAASQIGIANVREVLYSPRPANPLAADLVVRTADAYHLGALRWSFGRATVTFDGEVVPRGDWSAPAVVRARTVPEARRYLVWSQFPYVRVNVTGADTSVFFGDARYYSGLARGLSGLQVRPPAP